MKKYKYIFLLLNIIIITSCRKDEAPNPLAIYTGNYKGQRVAIAYYKLYDPIYHQYISSVHYDTTDCLLSVYPNGNKLDFKEYDGNNTLIKNWHGFEVNNVGELAYFAPDTVGYGFIRANDSLAFYIDFPYPFPQDTIVETSDTLFYNYHYYTKRN